MMEEKSKIHFILVAGFSSDNQEVLGLKNILEGVGYSASAVSFYGPKIINDFTHLTEKDCVAHISKVVSDVSTRYEKVFGIGISLGGALLLEHAKKNSNLAGIVSIGTPFRLKNKRLMNFGKKIFPVLYPIWRQLQKIERWRLNPLGAAPVMVDFMERRFLENLESITTPVLFLHSRRDGVTDYLALEEYLPRIASVKKEVIFFKNGNHVISYNPLIAEEAFNFFDLTGLREKTLELSSALSENIGAALEFEKMKYDQK